MSTQSIPGQSDFRERAKTNDVPVARLIGFEVKEIGDGRASVVLTAGPQHANPMGTLHGGILCDIADAAMGIAFATTVAPDETFTTVELKINFFRPASLASNRKAVRARSLPTPMAAGYWPMVGPGSKQRPVLNCNLPRGTSILIASAR